MGFSYTEEQLAVIDSRGCSLLVSAAAGSGKTAVLVERIVRIVSDADNPVDIDRLLIVTFTNAAAAQMRERISEALGRRLEEDGDNAHLQRQLTLLHNAKITTIDSFCLFILRNNFNDIGLDPGFRVADEGELKLLRGEVMEAFLEEWFEKQDADFLHCLESFHPGGDEKALAEHILRLYDFSRSLPFPEAWLVQAAAEYAPEDGERAEDGQAAREAAAWLTFAVDDMKNTVSACAAHLEAALAVCEQPDGPYMYAPVLEAEREMLSACRGETFQEYEAGFARIAFGRLPSKKDDSVSGEKRELVKGMRTAVKDAVEKVRGRYFAMSCAQAFADLRESGRIVRTVVSLTLAFGALLAAKKREKNILDFNDMEHYALRIMLEETENGHVPSKTAKEYRQYFHEIMIDEYQDSNLVQEYLLQSISGEAEGRYNRFMVGDVKQSIYRFRQARPEIFMEKYGRYGDTGAERRIILHRNFRSRHEVTDMVNYVFSRIMKRDLGGIAYDAGAALYPGGAYPAYAEAASELLLLAADGASELSRVEQEAALVAGRIRRLLACHQVTDAESGLMRPVRYGDIAILLRTNAGWDETLQRVLKQQGIPAHTTSSRGYFSSEEIRTMLHMLRILDNPLQDIPLFGVMHSLIGGFTDSDIAAIRAAAPEAKLYEALEIREKAAAQTAAEAAVQEKAVRLLALIRTYRARISYEPVRQILREILAETGYLQYMTAFPDGGVRRANLEMLLLKAADYEKTGSHGLFSFIRYMEQLEQYEVDYGEAGTVDEYADVVRIMSIHKSKGLEFPVCIVAGLAKRFHTQDETRSLLTDVDLGIGCVYVDPAARLKRSTLHRNVLARKQKLDNLGEELRILYVAMTRAKEKLIMTGCIPEPAKKLAALGMQEGENGWTAPDGMISFLTRSGAGSLLDFLLPAWPGVVVTDASSLRADAVETLVKDRWRQERLADYGQEICVPAWRDAFAERFAYTYPRDLSRLYTKTTVSELKAERMTEASEGASALFSEQREAYIPRFCVPEVKQSGAARGSAFHRVMELLDFSAVPVGSPQTEMTIMVKKSVEDFLRSGRMQAEETACVAADKIGAFLCSGAAARMQAAAVRGDLHREQPFMLGLAADRLRPEFPHEETVLIQGIIDVYWEEDGKLIVLDYKTDRIGQPQELVARYRAQLDYYGEALARITGKQVKEKLIYSFYLDQILECP